MNTQVLDYIIKRIEELVLATKCENNLSLLEMRELDARLDEMNKLAKVIMENKP